MEDFDKTNEEYAQESKALRFGARAIVITIALAIAFIVGLSTCEAQVEWPTYSSAYKNPVIIIDATENEVTVQIKGTTAKTWVGKDKLPKLKQTTIYKTVTVHDTITVVLDPKKSVDYISMAATLAGTVIERDQANADRDRLIAENFKLKERIDQYVYALKILQGMVEQDTTVMIRIPKKLFKQ